jgi:hypothetical protein
MNSFPSSLPNWQTSIDDQQTDPYIRFSTDSGPGKVRKRYTGEPRELTVSMTVDGSERNILDNFHSNNVDFLHEDPRDDTIQGWRFRQPPQYSLEVPSQNASKRIWSVKFNLFRLP